MSPTVLRFAKKSAKVSDLNMNPEPLSTLIHYFMTIFVYFKIKK